MEAHYKTRQLSDGALRDLDALLARVCPDRTKPFTPVVPVVGGKILRGNRKRAFLDVVRALDTILATPGLSDHHAKGIAHIAGRLLLNNDLYGCSFGIYTLQWINQTFGDQWDD